MIAPAFHILHSHVPTPLAILGAATLETAITYGSQTRNAQMAYERASVLPSSHKFMSSLALRDLKVRCVYIACVFTMFSAIERTAVALWPSS